VRIVPDEGPPVVGVLLDAMEDRTAARAVLDLVCGGVRPPPLLAATAGPRPDVPGVDAQADAHKLGRERDHTTLRYDTLVLKLARRLEWGISPEIDLGAFLAKQGSGIAPTLRASLELRIPRTEPTTVAVVHDFVPNVGTAWDLTMTQLGRYFERALARPPGEEVPPAPTESPLLYCDRDPPAPMAALIDGYFETAARLGERLAEYHLAVSSPDAGPDFEPEPYTSFDRRAKYQSLRNLGGRVLRLLSERLPRLSARSRSEAQFILARERDIVRAFEPLLRARMTAWRIRTHGNLHLGHALATGKDFVFTDLCDFRGHSAAERRRKRSPLRDLAWMVQSFEVAAFAALLDPAAVRELDVDAARPWALRWTSWTSAAFLRAYVQNSAGSAVLAIDPPTHAILFDAFRFERALYHLESALEDASDRVMVPLLEIAGML
jgi:maltose alpha-D-glucosyltransferase/alpha-amylase